MSNITYTPGTQNAPFGLSNANAVGANYIGDASGTVDATKLLGLEIRRAIVDTAPSAYYDSLKLMYASAWKAKASDEFTYFESTFGRSPIVASAGVGSVAASPGNVVTQPIVVTNDSLSRLSLNMVVGYNTGEKGTITNIAGNTITISSYKSFGLGAVAINSTLPVITMVGADGDDRFYNYSRMETIERYNYIQFLSRSCRWDRIEQKKWENKGTTDFMIKDKAQKMEQIRFDMLNSMWNGQRGEVSLANGRVAKTMGGIIPSMQAAGASFSSATPAGFKSVFKQSAFATNHKGKGSTRFVHGTWETLDLFAESFKGNPVVRYENGDKNLDLDLDSIKVGGTKYVMVPTEIWKESSCYTPDFANKLVCLDYDSITPCYMSGIPQIETFQTDDLTKGTANGFTDYTVQSQISLEFDNPKANFAIQIM